MKDISIKDNGELEINDEGDLRIAENEDAIAQGILFRLKTVRGDFLLRPSCGASLETGFGRSNSPDTGDMLKLLAVDALIRDGFIDPSTLSVDVYPISETAINIDTTVVVPTGVVRYISTVDLVEGRVTHIRA